MTPETRSLRKTASQIRATARGLLAEARTVDQAERKILGYEAHKWAKQAAQFDRAARAGGVR